MSDAVEVTVILKDCERTLRQKFLTYDLIELRPDDPQIDGFINEALASFQGEPDEISIKCSMEIQ